MLIASSQQSFLINAFTLTHKPPNAGNVIFPESTISISCRYQPDDLKDSSRSRDFCCRKNENHLTKLAIVTLAAGVLALGAVDPASAAKTGGRVGGQAFRSPAPPPRASSPRINNSRTNIYINPPVAPPLVGGYGYGYNVPFYGGWGWSPFSFFAPGPSVAIGVGGGFEVLVLFMFLGAVTAIIRRFLGSRDDGDDY